MMSFSLHFDASEWLYNQSSNCHVLGTSFMTLWLLIYYMQTKVVLRIKHIEISEGGQH